MHVIQRGNNRVAIFGDQADYEVFLAFLRTAARRHRVGVHGYALTTNHWHLIVKPADVCAVILDGVKYFGPDMAAELKFRSPQDIALIEVYRYDETPMQYKDRRCGRRYAIVWTKLMIR